MNLLREQGILILPPPRMLNQAQPYNWFPLCPMRSATTNLRNIHYAPYPTHIGIELQGTIVQLRGDQVLAATLTLHPLLVHMDVSITCGLNLETSSLDYHKPFSLTSFFQPLPDFDVNPCIHFIPMNIIGWNVKRASGTDFRRVFREMVKSYKPNLVVLTETRVSGDCTNSNINGLGFERFIKVDAMGFSNGI